MAPRQAATMAVFVWIAAAGLAGCRSRALQQPDSGTGTGVLPTGVGGGGDAGHDRDVVRGHARAVALPAGAVLAA
jgi:hypothetical protein